MSFVRRTQQTANEQRTQAQLKVLEATLRKGFEAKNPYMFAKIIMYFTWLSFQRNFDLSKIELCFEISTAL